MGWLVGGDNAVLPLGLFYLSPEGPGAMDVLVFCFSLFVGFSPFWLLQSVAYSGGERLVLC